MLKGLLALMVAVTFVSAAEARPRHKVHHYRHHAVRIASTESSGCVMTNEGHTVCGGAFQAVSESRTVSGRSAAGQRPALDCGYSLAKQLHITEPKLARRLWVARQWLVEFPHASGPIPGTVAVLSRGRGGHVGLVTGVDASGNPIVESFRYYGAVGEAVYPRHRVLGYVWASS